MPAAATQASLVLIAGDDDFAVKQRARKLYDSWCAELGGMDHEIIPASVSNSGEALKVIARFREAMQTLPFFGGAKVIWLQNCNFLGEERTASSTAVTENLNELASELAAFDYSSVRILISAAKADKRRTFYKTIDKKGAVENFDGWSMDDRDWADQAEAEAMKLLRAAGRDIESDALAKMVANVGPHRRMLHSEVEKLLLYTEGKPEITLQDVDAIVTRNKQSRAFALGDALGERNLRAVLKALDEELWSARSEAGRSEIGLLYMLIPKIRAMLLMKQFVKAGWIDKRCQYNSFKTQIAQAPPDALPQDKKYNPLSMNPFILYRAMVQSSNYTEEELVRAMELLLQCNQSLIFSGLDEALVLQHTLVEIVGSEPMARPRAQ